MRNSLHARTRAVNIWLMAPLLGLAAFMAIFVAVRPAQAATSSNLNFQARLLTTGGAPVADGSYNIDFKIYNADSTTGTVGSCTGACLWEETRTNAGGHGVQVIDGYFSVNLGSVTSFPSTINWDQPLWLTMNVTTNGTMTGAPTSGNWDGEMQNGGHSIALTALPYSFVAGQLAKTDGSGNRGVLSFNTVANNPNLTLPDVASGTLCIQGSTACNFINNQTSVQTANFNIQSAATGSVTATIQGATGQTADLLDIKNSSTVLSVGNNGQTLLKPTSSNDTTSFFQIQNAAGTTVVMNTDTTNSRVDVGTNGTPTAQLYVAGLIPATYAYQTSPSGAGLQDIKIQGHYAYVVGYTNNKLYIYDITNPASPILMNSGGTQINGSGTGGAQALYVDGNYAYIAEWSAGTLAIMNISNPTSPTTVGTPVQVGGASTSEPNAVYVYGSYAYVSNINTSSAGLSVVNISNPYSPVVTNVNVGSQHMISAVVQGIYLYGLNGAGQLVIYNVSNPTSPSSVSTTSSAGSICGDYGPNDVSVNGVDVYVIDCSNSKFRIYDVSAPATPSLKNTGGTSTSSGPRSIIATGRTVYVGLQNTLAAFDTSNVSSPAAISASFGSNGGVALYLSGRYLYSADFGNNKLGIYDLGGIYTQTSESGSSQTGNLSVQGTSDFVGNANFESGAQINQGLLVNGATAIGGANSTTAFQVQNASGQNVLTVDSSNGKLIVGNSGSGVNGTLVFNNSAGSGTATITLAANPTTSYTYQLPTGTVSSNQCLQSGTVSSGTVPLTFGACGTTGTFLNKNSTDTSTFTGLGAATYGYTFTNNTSPGNSSGVLSLNNGSNTGPILALQGTSTTALQLQNSSSQNVLVVDSSTNPAHLKVYDGTATQDYVDIYYNDGNNTAVIAANTGTTQIGNGSGAVTINAGSGAAVSITGHTTSSWILDAGNLTIDATGASSTLNLGTGAQAKTIQIGTTSANTGNTQAINIGNTNAAGTTNVTIGAGASATGGTTTIQSNGALALGNTISASITLQPANTGNINVGTTSTTGAITIGGTGTTGTLTIGQANSSNSNTINLGANIGASGVQTINIGTSSTASSTSNITVGSTIAGTVQLQSAGGVLLGKSNSVNGSLIFENNASTTGITLNTSGTSSSYTLTLPTVAPAGGLCIETSTGNSSQLIFASCSNNNASIQEVHEWDANNTTTVADSPSTAGDEMVLTTQIPTGGVTVSSVSGGGVTTWNKVVTSAGNGTVNRVELWAGTVTSTGNATITVTYSSSQGANEITATEFTAAGVNSNTSWGIESSSSQLNSTSSATVTYPNMTAVNGSELYFGYAQVQNPPATAGSTTGFNYIQTSTQHNMITYDTSLAANTAYQPTANQNSSGQSNTVSAILTAFVTSSSINNTTSLQKANFYVQAATSGTVAGVLQAASSGTADIMDLRNSGGTNVMTVSSAGNVLIQPAASASAFQIQNGSNYNVLAVDTSANKVVLGNASHLSGNLTFQDSGDSNTISIIAPSTVATSYSLTLPTNTPTAGLCLGTSPSNANQLIFASCATQVSAASISYVNKWQNSGSGVTTISDSPTSVGDLLLFFSHTTNNVTINSISGGGVTNWTKITGNTGVNGGNAEVWRGVVTTTGAGTVTVSYSSSAGTNDIVAQEFTMGSSSGTWAVDTSGSANGTSATINYPSLTPAASSELYAGYAWGANTMSAGSTTGYTYLSTSLSKYLAYDTNVTGGTAQAPTASQNTSGYYNSVAALIAAYAGTSVIVNSTAVQQANFDVQAATSGTVAGVLQAASSGSADVLQVKDSLGNNVISVNPSSGLTLGTSNVSAGSLIFAASGNSNTITITAPSAPGSSYSLTLPTTTPAAGQCLATSPSNANQLVFSSCANQVTSIAISYVNSWKVSTSGLSPTLSVSPANLGDLLTFFIYASKSNTINSVSGGGVTTWTRLVSANSEEMWKGVVTSTGSSTISVSLSTPSGPTDELAAQEWTTGSATGSWVVDTSNSINNSSSTTVTYPSLTPQSTKDLYIGYAVGTSTMSAGSTSGYTYFSGAGSTFYGAYNNSVSTTSQPTASQSSSGTSFADAALIAAYSSSSVISNSTVTQEANFNIQAATSGSVAGVLQAFPIGTGDILDLEDGNGTLVDSFGYTGNLLVKPSTASAAAFQVQTTGGVNVLSVDTNGKQVVVGAGATGESSPSLLVVDNETGTSADPTEVNGAIYYNATTQTFRCGVAGAWQNCGGLIYANTSKSSAVSNCSNNCGAFSTYASIPANYCQAGKVIRLSANGYFSSQASATNIQFGVYYGTDSSVASNDVLLGTVSPAASVTSASNNYFQINMDINCFSTTSMQAGGVLGVQIGAAASGLTSLPMNSTSAATVVTTSTKNIYIFPIWGTASSSNTATLAQFGVNSP